MISQFDTVGYPGWPLYRVPGNAYMSTLWVPGRIPGGYIVPNIPHIPIGYLFVPFVAHILDILHGAFFKL